MFEKLIISNTYQEYYVSVILGVLRYGYMIFRIYLNPTNSIEYHLRYT